MTNDFAPTGRQAYNAHKFLPILCPYGAIEDKN